MKTNKVLNYQSILETLSEPGCPFCRFLKNYQAALMQRATARDVHNLCNFHVWGLAATHQGPEAAQVMIGLLETEIAPLPKTRGCDICIELQLESDRRVREMIGLFHHHDVDHWLKSQPALCLPHGIALKRGLPLTAASAIDSVIERYRSQLARDLRHLADSSTSDTTSWGVLGHAAEFVVAQRGLHP